MRIFILAVVLTANLLQISSAQPMKGQNDEIPDPFGSEMLDNLFGDEVDYMGDVKYELDPFINPQNLFVYPEISCGADIYMGGDFATLLNPGLSIGVKFPLLSWPSIPQQSPLLMGSLINPGARRSAILHSVTCGLDYTHTNGKSEFQLNEPVPGGIQVEIADVNIFFAKLNYELERIILDADRTRHSLFGIGVNAGTVNANLREMAYNPAKTQFFVPVGSSISSLGSDGLFGGQIYGEFGVSTNLGVFNFFTELFILQTGALSGGTSNSTGVSLGLEWRFGGKNDFDVDPDMDDFLFWQRNS